MKIELRNSDRKFGINSIRVDKLCNNKSLMSSLALILTLLLTNLQYETNKFIIYRRKTRKKIISITSNCHIDGIFYTIVQKSTSLPLLHSVASGKYKYSEWKNDCQQGNCNQATH